MNEKLGGPLLGAAAVLGAAIVASSLILRTSIDRTADEVASLRAALAELPRPAAAPSRPTARAPRPDPGRRYRVETKGAPARGPEGAAVSVVGFVDFQCPFCARAVPTMKQIQQAYGDDVRIVFKHMPLRMHPQAPAAHAAAEAAHRQGRFWEMHDRIFANPRDLTPARFVAYAEEMGLDVERFVADVASAEVRERVDGDAAEATRLGVTGTPAFFINGRFLSGAKPYDAFRRVIDEELASSQG